MAVDVVKINSKKTSYAARYTDRWYWAFL